MLARAQSKRLVAVNAIAPGLVPSKMSAQLRNYSTDEEIRRRIPLGRLGRPEDMAGAVGDPRLRARAGPFCRAHLPLPFPCGVQAVFLSSPAGSWTTGQILVVDGGHCIDVRAKL